jgi:hypothetical protein
MRENHDSIFNYIIPESTGTTVKVDPKEEAEPKEEKEMKKKKKLSRTEVVTAEDGTKLFRSFKIGRCPHEPGLQVYKKAIHSFKPGISILVGCNGSGKSTAFGYIQDILKENDIPVFKYSNLTEGGNTARESALFYGNLNLLAEQITSSEGENIVINIGTMAQKLGSFVGRNKEKGELWILLDAIDSGLSIDYIEEVKDFLHSQLIDKLTDIDLYILISTNNYELCIGEACYNVQDCQYIEIDSYETFKKIVKKTRANKSKFIKKFNDLKKRKPELF